VAQVNELAAMQTRVDNKYIADCQTVRRFADALESDFAVLEINNRRQFTYRSCYYDDEFRCYFDHLQQRRQRFKARTREYVDGGGLKVFEVKLKGTRGLTVKSRVDADFVIRPQIQGRYLKLLQQGYYRQYSKELDLELSPSLIVVYKRYTLVALQGGERVTIDHELSFAEPKDGAEPVQIGDGFMIIETKSEKGRGVSDRVLKSLQLEQASSCSKYCLGLNLLGIVSKGNTFGRTLKHLRLNAMSPKRGTRGVEDSSSDRVSQDNAGAQ